MQFEFITLKLTDFSSTVYSSHQMELTVNSQLFDASIAATLEEADIAPHDIITCEVMIVGTVITLKNK
jgi:hypothetical protein